MIAALSHSTVYVLDQESAKTFYTEKLEFEVRNDLTMGDDFEGAGEGLRWLTVGPKDQPDVELILADPRLGNSPETAEQVRSLVAAGAFGIGVLKTDDCAATYDRLAERGVEFVQAPMERPYGIEAILRDDSGNWYSLTERHG